MTLIKELESVNVHNEIVAILKEYVLESDIPLNHRYWNLLAQYRLLKDKERVK